MDAIVVYESLWGNTAEVAGAVAEGLLFPVPASVVVSSWVTFRVK